ncbi:MULTISPECIES: hypothetical protein [unclassified Shinella]|jgi:hypothetical protein|uniref:hypothetical protein n=1 Tax=unclassified Shinella TaxID=2643062 RepID=UPI0003C55ABD|nr:MULTISPECIES: hypothetical protein [unclassified Shinella]MCA0341050.1 hypothetical protein [Pseudomonadota bacterium]EYR84141.1 hypothetical protein SHLA_49c000240 [Shinella sp. DD12]MCO5152707.1 hypothetical protein [Shinella sp.]MDC7260698.1 hypothetical protein [Shinella sp. HY16]MDC7267593.1 hypothetical protein [Shinella sp. YZ44]
MAFGPARPPITEDVAEVIAKDVKEGEGHTPTSEVPLAFLKRGAERKPLEMNNRVQALFLGVLAAVLLLVVVLMVL